MNQEAVEDAVRSLCRTHDFMGVEQVLLQYGQSLEAEEASAAE